MQGRRWPVVENGTVMLLGSGEPSTELVIALQRLGAEVIAVAVDPADSEEVAAAIRRGRPNFVVIATDIVATDVLAVLTAAAETGRTQVVPGVRGLRLAADVEGMRRLAADELGLPTAPFWFAGSVDELAAVASHAGFPMVVKPVAAPPGEGRSVMVRADDVEPAWQRAVSVSTRAQPVRVLAETVVEVDHEVTLLGVHSDGPAGPVLDFCAPIGHRSVDGPAGRLMLESWQPHAMSPAALDAARSIAARIVRALGGRGLFGVELLTRGDEVYFSGVTVAPYDAAWVTLRTQRLSGFELQARAILGLGIDPIMISPGAARLTYSARQQGPAGPVGVAGGVLSEALDVAESDVVVFGRPGQHQGHPRRRLGVAMATASDVATARDRAEQVSAALSKLWQ